MTSCLGFIFLYELPPAIRIELQLCSPGRNTCLPAGTGAKLSSMIHFNEHTVFQSIFTFWPITENRLDSTNHKLVMHSSIKSWILWIIKLFFSIAVLGWLLLINYAMCRERWWGREFCLLAMRLYDLGMAMLKGSDFCWVGNYSGTWKDPLGM